MVKGNPDLNSPLFQKDDMTNYVYNSLNIIRMEKHLDFGIKN